MKEERMKKTSPLQKIKTASNKLLPPTPKFLKRLQPLARSPSTARTSPTLQQLRRLSIGKKGIKPIILKWENIAQEMLTPAVMPRPKVIDFVDSQPAGVLETRQENGSQQAGSLLEPDWGSRQESEEPANQRNIAKKI